jgi:hypothetical protein
VAHPIETPADLAQDLQPGLAVIIREIDVFTPVTPAGDVIKTTGKLESPSQSSQNQDDMVAPTSAASWSTPMPCGSGP